MEIGIFARTFQRSGLAETLDAVVASGLRVIHFDTTSAGLADIPEEIDPARLAAIRRELDARQLTMSSISGTFNIIHPDTRQREAGMRGLRTIAAACRHLGTPIVSLSTGTRNTENMWRPHPDNNTPDAWREMVESMGRIATIGEEFGVTMAFEPEVSNVVDSARKARLLLDDVRSPRVKVLMDCANIFHAGELPRMSEILDEAFDLLGADIALVHAKDLTRDGEAGHVAAGSGLLDYPRYLRLLRQARYTGPLILHGLNEDQVGASVDYLRVTLAALETDGRH